MEWKKEIRKKIKWQQVSIELKMITNAVQRADEEFPFMIDDRKRPPLYDVMQSIIKNTSNSIKFNYANVSFQIRNKNIDSSLKPGDKVWVDLIFFNADKSDCRRWINALYDNIYELRVLRVYGPNSIDFKDIETQAQSIPDDGEIVLYFTSPISVPQVKGKYRGYIDSSTFLQLCEERINNAFGCNISFQHLSPHITCIPWYWHFKMLPHNSKSHDSNFHILGYSGPLYIRGKLSEIRVILTILEKINLSKTPSYGRGQFKIQTQNTAFFDSFFPSKQSLVRAIEKAIERYDRIRDDLADEGYSIDDINTLANELYDRLLPVYTPRLYKAYTIEQKPGKTRLIEEPTASDLIIQYYFMLTVNSFFDRVLEEESIGYRRGGSPQKAAMLAAEYIKQGYEYIVETDIADFFPTVSHPILEKKLQKILPLEDKYMLTSLMNIVKTDCIYHGRKKKRKSGIAIGSPLSPMLANIYLDEFDEAMKALPDTKLIRYADGLLLLCKSKLAATNALKIAVEVLQKDGLKIKAHKTSIQHYSKGINFLGKDINPETLTAENTGLTLFKKSLVVIEEYCALRLNDNNVAVYKNGKNTLNIPLRRLQAIILLRGASFTSFFINKMNELHIPIAIGLTGQKDLVFIHPDTKTQNDRLGAHYARHSALSDAEKLSIAAAYAVSKLINLGKIFKQRYQKNDKVFFNKLSEAIEKINNADNIESIRAYEGAATKLCYARMNKAINNPAFHFKNRHRPATDPINSMLNFGFYLLFIRVRIVLQLSGLNPWLGFLHVPSSSYSSLTADVQEQVRAHIIRMIIRLINLKTIKPVDFEYENGKCRLTKAGKTRFVQEFETVMATEILPVLRTHTHSLVKWVEENKPIWFYHWN